MGVSAMLSKKIAALIAAAFAFSLLTAISPATAEDQGKNGKDLRIKCKNIKNYSKETKQVERPSGLLRKMPRTMTLATNCGDIVIRLNTRQARVTITALATLIAANYYDNTACHRLTTDGIYVIQCGDPSATGYGDPGFSYRDENLPLAQDDNYPRGTVAMANSGMPSTNGSQFFLVYGDTTLPPNYTVWGQIIQGLEIIDYIAAGGVRRGATDGLPVRMLVIEEASLR